MLLLLQLIIHKHQSMFNKYKDLLEVVLVVVLGWDLELACWVVL
jgi:hypothetical protein